MQGLGRSTWRGGGGGSGAGRPGQLGAQPRHQQRLLAPVRRGRPQQQQLAEELRGAGAARGQARRDGGHHVRGAPLQPQAVWRRRAAALWPRLVDRDFVADVRPLR